MGIFPWSHDAAAIAHTRQRDAWERIYRTIYPPLRGLRFKAADLPNQAIIFAKWVHKDWAGGKMQLAYNPKDPPILRVQRPQQVVDKMNATLDTLKKEVALAFKDVEKEWRGYEWAHREPKNHPDHPVNIIEDYAALEGDVTRILLFRWWLLAIIEGSDEADTVRRELLTGEQLDAEERAKNDQLLVAMLQKYGLTVNTRMTGYRHRFQEFSDNEWAAALETDLKRYITVMALLIQKLGTTLETNYRK